jgi:cobalamin synthase
MILEDVGAGATGVVLAMIVVVLLAIALWSSSSSSDGRGRRTALAGSILSPHNLRCQSVNVPLNSFMMVSLTTIVQVPTPFSPL